MGGTNINSRNGSGRRNKRLMNEINVTPMVDVMLVLLIIFMITAPMLVAGIEVDLPKTSSAPVSSDTPPLTISINKKEEIFIFETKVELGGLVAKLNEITKENKNTKIFIRGDKNLSYGKIVEIISHVRNAGFIKAALVSDIDYK